MLPPPSPPPCQIDGVKVDIFAYAFMLCAAVNGSHPYRDMPELTAEELRAKVLAGELPLTLCRPGLTDAEVQAAMYELEEHQRQALPEMEAGP